MEQNLNGDRLEFYDVDERKSLSVQEHYLCTHVMWDPSGRIVTTAVAQSLYGDSPMRYTMQNGYMLWTFQGMLIHDEGKEKLYQFQWRPRPPSLLDRKKREDVKANLKKSIARYQAADRRKANRRKFKKYRQRQLERQAFMVSGNINNTTLLLPSHCHANSHGPQCLLGSSFTISHGLAPQPMPTKWTATRLSRCRATTVQRRSASMWTTRTRWC